MMFDYPIAVKGVMLCDCVCLVIRLDLIYG
jgi:hypothetical protein